MVNREIVIKETKVSVVQGDITLQQTEAIVNAANQRLVGGGGVDGAIHRAAGPSLLEQCKLIVSRKGPLPTGKALITDGGNLAAKYVIHTVGPIWQGGRVGEPSLLESAYRESLTLATKRKLASLSFPSISTGAYGYPLSEASRIAVNAVAAYLREQPTSLREVVFVLYDARSLEAYSTALSRVAA
jgi:O-acetyl-ADP-ribose deacetylase